MTYDELLAEADGLGLIVKEKPLESADGRICGNRIAIRNTLNTSAEKACVLAEELGHYYTSSGDIIRSDQYRQERKARLWAYDKMVGISAIVEAFRHGCRSRYDMAQYMNVTEEFLSAAVSTYGQILPGPICVNNYTVFFSPSGTVSIMEML